MPWKATSAMSLRLEFVLLAMNDTANIRSLCRRYEISPRTAYKWIDRYCEHGTEGLEDRSRRPHHSPRQTAQVVEQLILRLRKKHPAWGARKLGRRLLTQGHHDLPSVSTMTAILRRHGCIDPLQTKKHQSCQRFEAPGPNLLWQMDFKGDFPLLHGRCYPLTILDDHSRFALGLVACSNQRLETVQHHLTASFRRYGLPQRILTDNGGPWGSCGHDAYTEFDLWMIRLGIGRSHSRICHPQTLGKDERFHRTMMDEIIARRSFTSTEHCQQYFDRWRTVYNVERPHEALAMDVPTSRYQPSPREYPETLPPITYGADDIVRKVGDHGEISFHGIEFKIGKAFHGYPVALRPTITDGLYNVLFCHENIAQINLNNDIHQP
ncbi:MAG TPA: IS481 family transposase [Bacteroidota bacterium]|nr:IS481 family transposase [Bacteroidota bacterium]